MDDLSVDLALREGVGVLEDAPCEDETLAVGGNAHLVGDLRLEGPDGEVVGEVGEFVVPRVEGLDRQLDRRHGGGGGGGRGGEAVENPLQIVHVRFSSNFSGS